MEAAQTVPNSAVAKGDVRPKAALLASFFTFSLIWLPATMMVYATKLEWLETAGWGVLRAIAR